MSSDAVALYPLGQKVSDAFANANMIGVETHFEDRDYSAVGVKPTKTPAQVHAVLVKNTGAGALAPGSIVKWSVPGQSVAANAGLNEIGCGIVDPYLNSSVAQNEVFWMIVKGPVPVLSSAAVAANAPVKTAASGKSVTSDYSSTAIAAATFGKQIDAAGGADELKRVLVDFRNV